MKIRFRYRNNFLIKQARGNALDIIGLTVGLKRKKRYFFFGVFSIDESDKEFRKRIYEHIKNPHYK